MHHASQVVDSIFARMLARYGSAWTAKWAGVPMEAVKDDWANAIRGFSRDDIVYALGYLPAEFPPNAAQFRAICTRAPTVVQPALPAPKADPERVAAIVGGLREKMAHRPRMQWAYDLQEREKRGEALTLGQRSAWRDALAVAPMDDHGGWFTPIDSECLPPGMRSNEITELGKAEYESA